MWRYWSQTNEDWKFKASFKLPVKQHSEHFNLSVLMEKATQLFFGWKQIDFRTALHHVTS